MLLIKRQIPPRVHSWVCLYITCCICTYIGVYIDIHSFQSLRHPRVPDNQHFAQSPLLPPPTQQQPISRSHTGARLSQADRQTGIPSLIIHPARSDRDSTRPLPPRPRYPPRDLAPIHTHWPRRATLPAHAVSLTNALSCPTTTTTPTSSTRALQACLSTFVLCLQLINELHPSHTAKSLHTTQLFPIDRVVCEHLNSASIARRPPPPPRLQLGWRRPRRRGSAPSPVPGGCFSSSTADPAP